MTPLEKVARAAEGRNPEETWVCERIGRRCIYSSNPARGKLCLTGIRGQAQTLACDRVKSIFQEEIEKGNLKLIEVDLAELPKGIPCTTESRLTCFLKEMFQHMGHDLDRNWNGLSDWEKWDFCYHLEAWVKNQPMNSLAVLLKNYDALFEKV